MRVTQKALLLYLAVSDCNTWKSLPHSHWLANGDIPSTLQLVKQPVGSETIPSSCEVTCNSCEFMQTDNVVKEVWPVSIAHNVASFFCSRIHSYRISFPFHQQPFGWLVGHQEVKAYFGVQSLLKLQGYPLTASYSARGFRGKDGTRAHYHFLLLLFMPSLLAKSTCAYQSSFSALQHTSHEANFAFIDTFVRYFLSQVSVN